MAFTAGMSVSLSGDSLLHSMSESMSDSEFDFTQDEVQPIFRMLMAGATLVELFQSFPDSDGDLLIFMHNFYGSNVINFVQRFGARCEACDAQADTGVDHTHGGHNFLPGMCLLVETGEQMLAQLQEEMGETPNILH